MPWAVSPSPPGAILDQVKQPAARTVATNRKALHDYHILERIEAGVELVGTEVKSLRDGQANLRDSYAAVSDGQMYLHNVHISPYSHGNISNHDPMRVRRLLLHKDEIGRLAAKTAEKGLTIVPLRIYFSEKSKAKVELGLARGKQLHDKRRAIAERDMNRELARELRQRQKG